VRAQHPDLVLLDMRLPDMGGLEFFARLRADPRAGRVACVAVSANALAEELRAALDAGIDGYLTKPLDAGALYAVIDGLTALSAPAAGGRTSA
jgi:CheY-like chemotaxis protein